MMGTQSGGGLERSRTERRTGYDENETAARCWHSGSVALLPELLLRDEGKPLQAQVPTVRLLFELFGFLLKLRWSEGCPTSSVFSRSGND